MSIVATTNTEHYENIADSVRYSKDGMEYENELLRLETEIANDNVIFEDISDAVQEKMGQVEPYDKTELAGAIETLPSLPLEKKDVNFYDYDGTLLYSYIKEEALNLSELPELPTHQYLVTDNWTHTIEQIKTRILTEPFIDVGATYHTIDNKTFLFLVAENSDSMQDFFLNIRINKGTLNVIIDGNVVATQTNAASSYRNYTIYFDLPEPQSYPANYIVELLYSGEGTLVLGQGSESTSILGIDSVKRMMLRKIYVGANVDFAESAFNKYSYLEKIMLSNGISIIYNSSFSYDIQLKHIIIPNSITSISRYAFINSGLELIVFNGTINIGREAFVYCPLKRISIPNTITSDSYAPFRNSRLKQIIISGNFDSSEGSVFQESALLFDITILSGAQMIVASMFRGCTSLNKICISNSVKTIKSNAFYQCSNLYSVDLSDYTDPTDIPILENSSAFSDNRSSLVFLCANQEMLEAFTTATNWSSFTDRFQIKGGDF